MHSRIKHNAMKGRLHASEQSSRVNLLMRRSSQKKKLREIEELKNDIEKLRKEIDVTSQDYVQCKEQEAVQRHRSQQLLREQQESKELLKELEKDAKEEAEKGKLQVEDLEQQVADLTAELWLARVCNCYVNEI